MVPTARVDSGQKPEFARVFLVQGKGIEGEGQDEKMGGGTQREGRKILVMTGKMQG